MVIANIVLNLIQIIPTGYDEMYALLMLISIKKIKYL